ncbi:MAG: protein translocase subunit SecD [Austwickia sp.]|nr:protein translocase subunit SecD [Austwickia sp.]
MARNPHRRTPIRTLLAMLVITLGLAGFLLAVNRWGEADLTPKLGLDLEGGTQMILRPQVRSGEDVNTEELSRAVDIIRKRVDGQGVAEAEVSTLGTNVVVTVPGKISQEQQRALEQSSQMRFRPVLAILPTGAAANGPETLPGGTGTAPQTGNPTTLPGATGAPTGTQPASIGTAPGTAPATPAAPAGTTSAARGVLPEALRTAGAPAVGPAVDPTTPAPAGTTAATPAATTPATTPAAPAPAPTAPAANPFTSAPADPNAAPQWSEAVKNDPKRLAQYATSQAWLTAEVQQAAIALQCPQKDFDPTTEDLTKPQVICGSVNPQANNQVTEKYVLGPAILTGDALADANSGPQMVNGATTGKWVVNLRMQGGYPTDVYAAVSQLMVGLQQPANQLAVVMDGRVISAPYFSSAILDGSAEISGNFTAESAKLLADQLKFGSLPMSFQAQELQDISPTIGGDQLRKGLIAGLIGLLLVVVYSLFQYRALGFVTVASIAVVALLTYLMLTLFGWSQNLRLTMAGVTGAIVAIGTTADSFIVYFERVRDEIREGRALQAAVETGWARAKRTILISDAVNFLAAAVLYLLAASNVRGFAFMLMLTTALDVLVTFLFTHPLLTLLATTKFFGGGHPWSGLSPDRLGAVPRYRGRGRVAEAPALARQARPTRRTGDGAEVTA